MMIDTVFEPVKDLPVLEETDVVVVGGGTAGCISAIAAARTGARVALIEKMPYPGGQFAAGGMVANSLYASTDDNAHPTRLVKGIASELIERIQKVGGTPGFIPTRNGNHYRRPYVVTVDHEIFHMVISDMLSEAGVHTYLNSTITGVNITDRQIKSIVVQTLYGRFVVTAKQYVDATGDGDLAYLAGCPQEEIWDKYGVNQIGLAFGMNQIDYAEVLKAGIQEGFLDIDDSIYDEGGTPLNGYIRMVLKFRNVPKYRELVDKGVGGCLCISIHPNQMSYSNSVNIKVLDVMDAKTLTKAEVDLRKEIINRCRILSRYVPGFKNAYVHWSADYLGIRVTRITLCVKNMTNEEFCSGKRFEDEIGLYGYHDLLPVDTTCAIRGEGFFGLPYRMILALKTENLLMAGRTITNEFKAHMVTRNTMCSMITGQAAGAAAGLCAKNDFMPRDIPYARIRDELLKQNVQLTVEQ